MGEYTKRSTPDNIENIEAQAPVSSPRELESQSYHVAQREVRFGSPSTVGLISFATDIFLIAVFNLHARSVAVPNVFVGVLVFFGGVGQLLAAIFEFICGSTFGSVVWVSYSAFNFSYAMIYLPGSGIMAAYTDPKTGAISPEFNQALAIYCWAWFIVSTIFLIASIRSNWALFLDFFFLDVAFILLAAGYMVNSNSVLQAGNAVLLISSFLSYWLGAASLWGGDATPIQLPIFPMHRSHQE